MSSIEYSVVFSFQMPESKPAAMGTEEGKGDGKTNVDSPLDFGDRGLSMVTPVRKKPPRFRISVSPWTLRTELRPELLEKRELGGILGNQLFTFPIIHQTKNGNISDEEMDILEDSFDE